MTLSQTGGKIDRWQIFSKNIQFQHNFIGLYQEDIALRAPEYTRNRRAVTSAATRVWENGIIPYVISNAFRGNIIKRISF